MKRVEERVSCHREQKCERQCQDKKQLQASTHAIKLPGSCGPSVQHSTTSCLKCRRGHPKKATSQPLGISVIQSVIVSQKQSASNGQSASK